MTFDSVEEITREQELWTDVALKIYSKSGTDVQDLIDKMNHYKKAAYEQTLATPGSQGKKSSSRLRSAKPPEKTSMVIKQGSNG